MKFALASAAFMAAAANAAPSAGEQLTRFLWSDGNCDGDATWDSTSEAAKVNVNKFEYIKDADATGLGYIEVWMYQYFTADAATNIATPDDAYDSEAAAADLVTATAFDTAMNDAAGLNGVGGRAIYSRIDLQTAPETSCTYAKVSGVVAFVSNYVWAACTDGSCSATIPYSDNTNDFDVSNDDTRFSEFAYGSETAAAAGDNVEYLYPFNKMTDAGAMECLSRTYSFTGEGITTNTGLINVNSPSDTFMHMNVVPDAAADSAATDAEFDMDGVFEKLCGDSSRLASVAAFTVASVAASLLF